MIAIRGVSGRKRRLVQVDLAHLRFGVCGWDIANLSKLSW
jgi:hypothetical protein